MSGADEQFVSWTTAAPHWPVTINLVLIHEVTNLISVHFGGDGWTPSLTGDSVTQLFVLPLKVKLGACAVAVLATTAHSLPQDQWFLILSEALISNKTFCTLTECLKYLKKL